MPESWYKEYCPKCDTINWICNGDESDLTQEDVDAIKCRKCDHIFSLGEIDDWMEIYGWKTLEDSNWEIGKEKPE
jgi:phage FluMu protein Com